MRRAAAGCLVLLGACGGSEAGDNHAEEAGFTVTLGSEDVEAGARPRLTIACGEVGRSLMLHLVRRPAPTHGGGAAGLFKVDNGAAQRVDLAWVQDDIWSPRMADAAKAALIRRMVAGRSVYFTGPLGTTEHVYRWDMERLGENLGRLRAACG